jgi:serine protease AprX
MIKNKLIKAVFLTLFLGIFITSGISQREGKISPRLLQAFDNKSHTETLTAWIYFRDKGPGKFEKMEEVKMGLNVHAMNRRLRHGFDSLVDEHDLPVYEPYLDSIEQFVTRIRHASRWLNAASVEATRQSLETISEFRFVQKVDEVMTYTFHEPEEEAPTEAETGQIPRSDLSGALLFDYGMSLSQIDQLNIPPLHNLGFSGSGVLVCMLDSGVNNFHHQALDHIDIVATWDFVNGDASVFDESDQMGSGDHGTYTLGAIAGYEPGKLIGPAFGASFLLGKTENTDSERHIEEDHWIAGAEWADTLGADIISSSLGYRGQFSSGEADYSWEDMDGETTVVAQGANIAASRGILIVNCAGNEGGNSSGRNTLVSPADCDLVLAAGAVNPQGYRTGFSSIGPTADGRIKPDVMAMGESVYTAAPSAVDEYELVDGTSLSAPLAAGVAALLLEINPSWTNQDIIAAMKSTASRSESPDNGYGWGIVDAQKAAFFPAGNLHAPLHFAVSRIPNDYGFFYQYVDRLEWAPNPRNEDRVASYRIYAKQLEIQDQPFEFVAEIDGQTYSFLRRGLLEDETFLYKITSVDAAGKESGPNYARR